MVHVYSWIQIYLPIPFYLSCLCAYLFNSCVCSASCQIITMSSFCKNAYSARGGGGENLTKQTNQTPPPVLPGDLVPR